MLDSGFSLRRRVLLLGCDAVYSGRISPFLGSILPPSFKAEEETKQPTMLHISLCLSHSFTLKMEAVHSSETSVVYRAVGTSTVTTAINLLIS
jgi:hypothetical protein